MDNILKRLYNDPKTGFIGQQKLYEKAKLIEPSITLKQVRDWYKSQESIQRFSTQKKHFDNFKIASSNPNSWQIDLAFWLKKSILTGININSRLGFAFMLPNKQAKTVLNGVKRLTKSHKVDIITSDNGSEFVNQAVEQFFQKNQIEHYNSEPGEHTTLGKIERFNRTLKQRLMKINKPLTQKLLKDVISNYNDTKHRAINATPNEMEGQVIESEVKHNQKLLSEVENGLSVGESVVYKLVKKTFAKESIRWSKTIYTIIGVDGFRVQIKSKNNHTLYKQPNDLRIVKLKPTKASIEKNQIWEAEEILEHKKLKNGKFKYLVKWKGYKEPTWEPQANLRLINKNRRSPLEVKYFK